MLKYNVNFIKISDTKHREVDNTVLYHVYRQYGCSLLQTDSVVSRNALLYESYEQNLVNLIL
jgi:hypothetical protein